MIDFQSSMPPLSSHESEQSLCTVILDTINNEIDLVANLLSEGNKLLENKDDEINIKEIKAIIRNLNIQLFQHAIKMNKLKYSEEHIVTN